MKISLMGHYGFHLIKEHHSSMPVFHNEPFLFPVEVAVLRKFAVTRKQGYTVECDGHTETELACHHSRRRAVALHVTKQLKLNGFC